MEEVDSLVLLRLDDVSGDDSSNRNESAEYLLRFTLLITGMEEDWLETDVLRPADGGDNKGTDSLLGLFTIVELF